MIKEAKEQEEELEEQIKKYSRHISYNSNFLSNLTGVKQKSKASNYKDCIKNIFKAGRLINEYRTLDLSEKIKLNFDMEFESAKQKFKDMKLVMEQDTQKEINQLLKNIREMNKDKGFDIEVEEFEQKINQHKI